MTTKEYYKKEANRKLSIDYLEITIKDVFGTKDVTILEDQKHLEYVTIVENMNYEDQDVFDYDDILTIVEEYAKTITKVLGLPNTGYTIRPDGRECFIIEYYYKIA